MTKDILKDEIESFVQFHDNKNRQLEYFIQGILNNENRVFLNINDCQMQKWSYERKNLLEKIYGSHNMDKFHAYHKEWHSEFKKICDLLLIGDKKKPSLFQQIKGKDVKSIYENEKDKINLYIMNTKELNNLINKKIEMMQQRLSAMQNKTFEEFLYAPPS